jgi:uncharacterized protein YbjT (DUF2867 family)
VKQFVYSSLSNSQQESNGKYEVAHFTTKAKVEDYIRSKGFEFTFFPAPGFYYQNFQTFFPPKSDENGNLSITYALGALMNIIIIFLIPTRTLSMRALFRSIV